MSRCSRRWKCQHRDIEIQHRDVPESPLSQHRDVEIQCRDVPEHVEIRRRDVEANVATLQKGDQNKVYQRRNVGIQRRDVGIQRRDVTEAWVFGFFQCCDVTERVKFKKISKHLSMRKPSE